MYIPTAMLLDCIFQTWHWYWLSQRRGWTSKIDSIQLKMCPKHRHLSYHSNCTDCLPWAKEDLWFHTSKNNLHRNIIYERLIAVFDWMFLEVLRQGCVAQFVISEFTQEDGRKKRTAKRLSVTNVTGLLLACFVANSLKIDVSYSSTKRSVQRNVKFSGSKAKAKLLSRLSHKVCRRLSSPVLLRKFTIITNYVSSSRQ